MMKTLPLILVGLLIFPASLLAQDQDAWATKLVKAIRAGNETRVDRLVRGDTEACLRYFKGLAFDARADPDDELLSTHITVLKESWKRVHESELFNRYDRWVQRLSRRNSVAYEQAAQAMVHGFAEYQRLESSHNRNRKAWEDLRDTMMNVSRSFGAVGNSLSAARAWGLLAVIQERLPDATFDDERERINALQQFIQNRESWDWITDDRYKTNAYARKVALARVKALQEDRKQREAAGYDINVRGVDAYLVVDADKHEVIADLKFKVLKKPNLDMSWKGGSTPLSWSRIDVATDDAKHFDWFKGSDLFIVRPGANRYGVSLDGQAKGRGFVEAAAANRVKKPTAFFLDPAKQHPYAMWFFLGAEQQLFQGFNQNLAPTKERASVFYKSAASWEAQIAGQKVVFYDDNTNGKLFESDPYDYGLRDYTAGRGLDDEVILPMLDGMKVGSGVVGPFSNWVMLGGSWYYLRGKAGNTKVGVRPANPEYLKTGTIQMKWSGSRGAKPKVLVIAGTGAFKSARFNIASGKPVEVPVGNYHIQFGRVEQGKGERIVSASVLPGSSEDVVVAEGANTELAMGKPFKLDFTRGGEGDHVSISAFTIRVVGISGAIYTHVNGAAPAPDVLATKNPDGKSAKVVGGFINIEDPETLVQVSDNRKYRKVNISAGYFPIAKGSGDGDPILRVKVPKGSLVGLQQKKNKLFGKLLPIYK